jgi:acyl carrier protein
MIISGHPNTDSAVDCPASEVDPVLLCDDADFLNDLEADWLDLVEIIATIETEFGIEFDDEVIDELKLVGDLIGFVDRTRHR